MLKKALPPVSRSSLARRRRSLRRAFGLAIAASAAGALLAAQSPATTEPQAQPQPQPYEALHALEQSAQASQNPALLLQLAQAQEAYAGRALPTYTRLAALEPSHSPARIAALERGFLLALRDGQPAPAAAFSTQLEAEGHADSRALLRPTHPAADLAVLPGGVAGFAVMAKIAAPVSADRILAEFAGKVAQQVCWKCQGEHLTSTIDSYLEQIAALEAGGKRDGDTVAAAPTASNLSPLGIKVHRDKAGIHLEHEQKFVGQPSILAALGVDEAALRDSLQAGKPFPIAIHDDSVAIYPNAAFWKSSFPKLDQQQFARSLLHDSAVARVYLGVSALDRKTLQALISTTNAYELQGEPADMLALYGRSFALDGTHAWVPGGPAAEPIWAELAGASPAVPGPFFHALIEHRKPALVPFFYTLARLDPPHQAWATANIARTRRLYTFFTSLPEAKAYTGQAIPGTSFSAMLAALPLSPEGNVLFPGDLGVWTRGNVSATPDDVVLHLLGSRARDNAIAGTDIGDFLLVSHIAAHRPSGLDPESAQSLARNARAYSAFYPYFTSLTALDAPAFASFFRMADSIGRLPLLEQQLAWGQADSLIEWLILLGRTGAIDDRTAAHHFQSLCDRFAAATTAADRTRASFDLAQAILAPLPGGPTRRDADGTLRAQLASDPARSQDFKAVLALQQAPSLDAVFAIVGAAVAGTRSPATAAQPLASAPLPFVPSPADPEASREQRAAFLAYDPAPLERLVEAWNRNAAHPDQGETQRLASEMLNAAEPQLTLALYAPIYATFLRSTDTVIAHDPLFLRKHQFVSFMPAAVRMPKFPSDYSYVSFGPFGTYIEGAFAHFESAAGAAASTDWKLGPGSRPVMAEDVSSLRATPWARVPELTQRLVALRILAAREWIVAAATDEAQFASLGEETLDRLSVYRRAQLLHGIEARDWIAVWASMPLPDLFRLGGRYLARHPAQAQQSETVNQLRAATAAAGSDVELFAAIPNRAHGCDHLHLLAAGPYEDDENQHDPAYLAERAADLKLYLAERADRQGVSPGDAANTAEPVAAKVFAASPVDDYHDWRGMLRAYAATSQ